MQTQYTLTSKEMAVVQALSDLGKHIISIEFVDSRSGIGPYTVNLHYSNNEGSEEIVIDITDYSNW